MADEEKLRLKHNLCQRNYKKKRIENDPDFKSKQNKMSECSRKNRISKMNTSQLKAYRNAAAERKRKSRENKKKKELESNEHLRQTMDSTSSKDHSFGSYKKPQSLGKAVRKCARNLPTSPSKQKAVVMALANKVGLEMTNKMDISLSNSNDLELKEIVKNFYYRPDTDLNSHLSLEVGDWCLVKYDTESFAGSVTSVISNSGPYEVSVMHRSVFNWKWPDHPDKILYEANCIIKRLTPPEVVNARGIFKFNDLL